MDIVGFADISKNATTCKGALNPNDFIGQICPVYEFGFDDSVLVINRQGTALAMFDKEDIFRKFKCGYLNNIVTPPDLDFINQIAYTTKVYNRKGGYNHVLCNMVIEYSLMKGKFSDDFLWYNQ